MSLQDILTKILAQAKLKSAKMMDDAKKENNAKKSSIRLEIEAEKSSLEKKANETIEKALKKSESLANIDGRTKVLREKNEVIESYLDAIIEELSSMKAKEYEQLLATFLKNYVPIKEGTIFASEGKDNSTKGAVKIAKKEFKFGGSRDFMGGFIIESKVENYDFTFETLVRKVLRKELEQIIIKEVF